MAFSAVIIDFFKWTLYLYYHFFELIIISMKNKVFLWLLLIMGVTFVSCSDEQDGISSLTSNEKLMSDKLTLDDSDEAVALQLTPKMKELQKKMKSSLRLLTRASNTYGEDYDENFESNIFAIRELPLTIEARGVGNDANRKYFFCNQARDEVKLSNTYSPSDQSQQFYLKILPATSGIPYLIYSERSNTPLVVGHYRKHPDVNILIANADDNISNAMASWNLIASDYPGYFGIENEMYIGQSDPKNSWSIFYYVLEVNDNDEIRYGKYTKKPQQEFLLRPIDNFTLDNITFDLNNAKISDASPVTVTFNTVNENSSDEPYHQVINPTVNEKYWFDQNRSNLKFNLIDNGQFQLPTVLARKLVLLNGEEDRKVKYVTGSYQNFSRSVSVTVDGTAPKKSLVEVTVQLMSYNVEANYVVTAKYNDRVIKFSGVWHGFVVPNPKLVDPIITTRFFNCTTGEEIFNSSAAKSFKIVK